MARKKSSKPAKTSKNPKTPRKKEGQPYEDAVRNVIRALKDKLELESVSEGNGDITQKKLSRGAKKITDWKGIGHLQIVWDEQSDQAIVSFLNRTFATKGMTLYMHAIDPDGLCDENGVYHRPRDE